MTSGLILIAAILILGGVIATAGDRIGMRVGKARLSLFNLRPRQTATLITILTGGVISASTLGLLFAISEQLRTGVFELGKIQDDLATANSDLEQSRTNLNRTRRQKTRVERELSEAQSQRMAAQDRLRTINRSLQAAIRQEEKTEQQLKDTQASLQQTQENFQQAQQRLQQATQQSSELRGEIDQLQQERQVLIARQREREELVAQLDQELAQRDQEIAQREQQLVALGRQQQILEQQRAILVSEVQALDREIQALREGDVVLFNNQVIAAGVIQVDTPDEAQQVIDQVLRQANQAVLQAVLPSVAPLEAQVVKIRSTEVADVIRRISDGQPYVVQILSGGNYLIGEPCVVSGQSCIDVSANAVPNELVFGSGETITSVTIDPNEDTETKLQERLELLISASQLRSRQAGVLPKTVQVSGRGYDDLRSFLEDLRDFQQSQTEPFVIRAVSARDIYTIGPLTLELRVLRDGQSVMDSDVDSDSDSDSGSDSGRENAR